jgi:hypothetical protein
MEVAKAKKVRYGVFGGLAVLIMCGAAASVAYAATGTTPSAAASEAVSPLSCLTQKGLLPDFAVTSSDVSSQYSTWTKDGFTPVFDVSDWKCTISQGDAGQFSLKVRPIQVKADDGTVIETVDFQGTISYISDGEYSDGVFSGSDALNVSADGKYQAVSEDDVVVDASATPSDSLIAQVSDELGGFNFDCNVPVPMATGETDASCGGFNYLDGVNHLLPLTINSATTGE